MFGKEWNQKGVNFYGECKKNYGPVRLDYITRSHPCVVLNKLVRDNNLTLKKRKY